jgi:hypothetical protein
MNVEKSMLTVTAKIPDYILKRAIHNKMNKFQNKELQAKWNKIANTN